MEYINSVTSLDEFTQPEGYQANQIKREGEIFVPSMDIFINVYEQRNMQQRSFEDRDFYKNTLAVDGLSTLPYLVLDYDHQNFGKVMWMDIIALTRTEILHYEYDQNRTLVISYNLSYLFKAPPKMSSLENGAKERAIDLIERTEAYMP